MIEDAVVFKSKIFVLTSHNEIGVLRLKNSHPCLSLLKVKCCGNMTPRLNSLWYLVSDFLVSEKMIYEDFFNRRVYEINFSKMPWVEMQNLGDQAFFFQSFKDLRTLQPNQMAR